MYKKAVVPLKKRPNEYYRLYFTIINMYGEKKTWVGAENKNKDVLEHIGSHVAKGKNKFYITKIMETRV